MISIQNKKLAGVSAILITFGLFIQKVLELKLSHWISDSITITFGILYEAIPFVILGIILSVLIQNLVSSEKIYEWLPKKGYFRRPLLSILGVFLPVCECGNIPLSRGLIQKGLKPGEVLTFLLAAPIINPITIYTTSQAFPSNPEVMFIRVAAAFLIANIIGFIFASSTNKEILTEEFNAVCELHSHEKRKKHDFKKYADSFVDELLRLMPALVGGSLLAGLIQTAIPRSILLTVSSQPVLAILTMLALAFIVSICANVDAFFALSLSMIFPLSAIVGFLVLGPMVDIKILSMLRTTYKVRILIALTSLVFILSFLVALAVQYAF